MATAKRIPNLRFRPTDRLQIACKSPRQASGFELMIEIVNGGRAGTRTQDPLIKSQLLYQLSYSPAGHSLAGGPQPQIRGGLFRMAKGPSKTGPRGEPLASAASACPARGSTSNTRNQGKTPLFRHQNRPTSLRRIPRRRARGPTSQARARSSASSSTCPRRRPAAAACRRPARAPSPSRR